MLREEDRLLIAAGVDGSLPDAEALSLRVLLAESNEATILFRKLSADRDRLAAIPKYAAPVRIARNIANQIQGQVFPSIIVVKPSMRFPSWLPYAFAASVLIAVTCGSFVIFNRGNGRDEVAIDKTLPVSPVVSHKPPLLTPSVASNAHRETLPIPDATNVGIPGSSVTIAQSDGPKNATSWSPEDWFGARVIGNAPDLESTSARFTYLFSLADAGQSETKKRLQTELSQSPAVRIDLFSRDVPKSVELLQSAARASGLQLNVSVLTLEQLKRKLPISVLLYEESLTAEELAAMIQKLSLEDAKPNSFTQAHVVPALASDSRELKSLLGVDLGLWKRPKNEPGKPLSDGTLGQITNAIGKGTSKSAILLTYGPNTARMSPSQSSEIKQFLEHRGERSPKALPALIVVRAAN